jgi:ribosome-associated heat shock protein Hsp15
MTGETRMRLDLWLWRTRFFRTRTAASDAIEADGARIERDGQVRRIDKPSATVAAGDLISFATPSGPHVLKIVGLPERRGPAPEAALCYEQAMPPSGLASGRRA